MVGELHKGMIIRLRADISTLRIEGGEWKLSKGRGK